MTIPQFFSSRLSRFAPGWRPQLTMLILVAALTGLIFVLDGPNLVGRAYGNLGMVELNRELVDICGFRRNCFMARPYIGEDESNSPFAVLDLSRPQRYFGQGVRWAPQTADFHAVLGWLSLIEGDLPAAEDRLQRALDLGSRGGATFNRLGDSLLGQGQVTAAQEAYIRGAEEPGLADDAAIGLILSNLVAEPTSTSESAARIEELLCQSTKIAADYVAGSGLLAEDLVLVFFRHGLLSRAEALRLLRALTFLGVEVCCREQSAFLVCQNPDGREHHAVCLKVLTESQLDDHRVIDSADGPVLKGCR